MKRKQHMKPYIQSITLLLLACILIPTILLAQPGFDDDVNDVPIDGGLSLLVAAAVGYGIKKINDKRTRIK